MEGSVFCWGEGEGKGKERGAKYWGGLVKWESMWWSSSAETPAHACSLEVAPPVT